MKELKQSWSVLCLILIFALGVFLRIYKLGSLPASMHRDELAIAYNAYSILETGKDEWGENWPITFQSFGDFKSPGAVYLTTAGIKLFGLNSFGARLPNALLAVAVIPLTFWFVKSVTSSNKKALLSSALLAFSWWHITGSRNIYEPIIALSLNIASYTLLYLANKKPNSLWWSLIFFGISIWFYQTGVIIYPLLFIIWGGIYWRQKKSAHKFYWLAAGLVILILLGLNYRLPSALNNSRSQTTLFFSSILQDQHQSRLHRFWSSGIPLYPVWTESNRLFHLGLEFAKGYMSSVSPGYLFFTGGNNPWHNLSGIGLGNINPILLPMVFLGLVYLYKHRRQAHAKFLTILLIISPIPCALTVDAPNTNRLLDFHWSLLVVSVWGFYWLIKQVKKKTAVTVLMGSLYLLFTSYFLLSYFTIYNKSLASDWQEGYPQLMQAVHQVETKYDRVVVDTSRVQHGYIFYLFYNSYPPQLYQAEGLPQLYFGPLSHLEFSPEDKLLVVTGDKSVPTEHIINITDWEGVTQWIGYEVKN